MWNAPRLLIVTAALIGLANPAPVWGQAAPPQRNLWAVVIGVEQYDDPRIPAAPGAAADARAVVDWLRGSLPEGWGLRGLFLADDGGKANLDDPIGEAIRALPTRVNLTTQLNQWLRDRIPLKAAPSQAADSRDVVLIYFAGHAIGLPPDPVDPTGIERHLLLPRNARPDSWTTTSLALEEDLLAPRPDNPLRDCVVICWLDTSLQGRGETPKAWPQQFQADSGRFLNGLVTQPGWSVWLAASGRPSGLTADGKGGLFSRVLLDALGPPSRGDESTDDLLGTLDKLRRNGSLEAQGFQVKGSLPSGLSPRRSGLGPRPEIRDQLVLQQGHSAAVRHFALTADEQTLITGSDDSSVRLWRFDSREVQRNYGDQFNGVGAFALDPGGRYLLSGDGVGNVRGYNVGKLTALTRPQLPRHDNGVVRVVRLPGKTPRFLTLDRIESQDGNPPTGGRLLAWRVKDDDNLEALPFLKDRNPPRIARIAILDDPSARACLVTLDDRGRLQGYDGELRPIGEPRAVGRTIDVAGIALGPGGARAVVLGDDGKLRRIDLVGGQEPEVIDLGVTPRPDGLVPGPEGLAVVLTTNREALLVPLDRPDDRRMVPAPAVQAAWSETGRWLATAGVQGPPRLWRIDPRGEPSEVAIGLPAGEPPPQKTTGLAIARGRLLAGDGLGGAHVWSLPDAAEGGRARLQKVLGPSRGQVQRVRANRDGRRLIAQTVDGQCWIWDLQANDGPTTLASRIQGMDVLGDGRGVAICREGGDGKGGRIALLDWQGHDLGVRLELPPDQGELSINDVSSSPDGRWLAGILRHNLVSPQVILWDLRAANPGKPAATIDEHPDVVNRAVFSADSRRLLTIDSGGNAFVRDLNDPGAAARPGARFEFGKQDVAAGPFGKLDSNVHLTAAAFDPEDDARFVVGTVRGELIACQTAATLQDRKFAWFGSAPGRRATTDLTFVGDPEGRRWLGAAFADVALRLWKADQDGFTAEALPGDWRHDEQVNSLLTWPVASAPMLVSGGGDGAIRFWGVRGEAGAGSRPLIGSLAVWPRAAAPIPDWIAYTPGLEFDGTPGGVQLLRRIGSRIGTLDQQDLESARVPNLAGLFAAGKAPAPRPMAATLPRPPALSVVEVSRPDARHAYLRISHEADVTDLRLYQNNVPVPITDANLQPIDQPAPSGQITTRVTLRLGVNQFYAMAAPKRREVLEGRSDPIEIRSEIREDEPRLHVLALGVGNYARRKLEFATKDADDLAKHLGELAAAGNQPLGVVTALLNDQVTERNLRNWFQNLRATVQDRPQDRVVVYLAGHTEITEKGRRFAMLPVDYQFADDWPTVVASRGLDERPIPANLESKVLMFSTILAQLTSVEARERLVIIDACQAEAIFNDPAVDQIRRTVDGESWKGRASYLLATRRGEAALEERKLQHGLMTYILLRGTGAEVANPRNAQSLANPVEVQPLFGPGESADLNGDQVITVPELQAFVKLKLPALLECFGGTGERGAAAGVAAEPSARSRSAVRPPVDEFPLVRLPGRGPERP